MKQNAEKTTLPNTLAPFVWHYLQHKKGFLFGFVLIALVWAIEMSLSPYLLKIIIDTVTNYSSNQNEMIPSLLVPASIYASMSLIINFNFRLYDYMIILIYGFILL